MKAVGFLVAPFQAVSFTGLHAKSLQTQHLDGINQKYPFSQLSMSFLPISMKHDNNRSQLLRVFQTVQGTCQAKEAKFPLNKNGSMYVNTPGPDPYQTFAIVRSLFIACKLITSQWVTPPKVNKWIS